MRPLGLPRSHGPSLPRISYIITHSVTASSSPRPHRTPLAKATFATCKMCTSSSAAVVTFTRV